MGHKAVNHQDVQQHGHVARIFDKAVDHLGEQPVGRKPQHAEEKPEKSCRNDAAESDNERVQHSDYGGP